MSRPSIVYEKILEAVFALTGMGGLVGMAAGRSEARGLAERLMPIMQSYKAVAERMGVMPTWQYLQTIAEDMEVIPETGVPNTHAAFALSGMSDC